MQLPGIQWSQRVLNRIPLFWRFQCAGWLVFIVLSLPLKWSVWHSVPIVLTLSLVKEPCGMLITTLLRRIYLRLDLTPERPFKLAILVIAISLFASLIELVVFTWLPSGLAEALNRQTLSGMFYYRGLLYTTWSFLYFWIRNKIADRHRILNLAKADAAAYRAELLMLRAQVNPHFLFNAFNTILAELDHNPKSLIPVVQGLADYLRYSLRHQHDICVPLADEFEASVNYLTVEKARFGDELEINCHISDEARDIAVPGIILQPLIENAVKYGRKSSPLPLRIRVLVTTSPKGDAVIDVTNTGRWMEPGPTRAPDSGSGLGLETLRRRLHLLYEGQHDFQIIKTDDAVRIRIELSRTPPLVLTPVIPQTA